jgi:hypothetical protein
VPGLPDKFRPKNNPDLQSRETHGQVIPDDDPNSKGKSGTMGPAPFVPGQDTDFTPVSLYNKFRESEVGVISIELLIF